MSAGKRAAGRRIRLHMPETVISPGPYGTFGADVPRFPTPVPLSGPIELSGPWPLLPDWEHTIADQTTAGCSASPGRSGDQSNPTLKPTAFVAADLTRASQRLLTARTGVPVEVVSESC